MSLVVLALLLAVITASVASDAPAFSRQGPQDVSVTIREATAPPDSKVALPVALAAPDAVKVGALTVRVGFPKALLSFVKMQLTSVAEATGAELRTQVTAGPTDDLSILEITISSAAAEHKPLPTGELARLELQIDKTAKPSTWIPLSLEATASTPDNPPRPITPVAVYKTRVGVALQPVTSCFYYMH